MANPLISDTRIPNFSPGDRCIIRLDGILPPDKQRRIERMVVKQVGCDIRLLLIPVQHMTLQVDDNSGEITTIAGKTHTKMQPKLPGVMNLDCSKVEIPDGSRLLVSWTAPILDWQKAPIMDTVRRWAGDVEVVEING